MSALGDKYRAIATEIREHPERVTRGAYARDADGHLRRHGNVPEAVCWCAIGFCDRDGLDYGPLEVALAQALATDQEDVDVTYFHDSASREAQAALFDAAADVADRPLQVIA